MIVPEGYEIKSGMLWPEGDDETRRSLHLSANDIDAVYEHCGDFESVVQAGGNVGMWPKRLAERFAKVYTFEPDQKNFRCLCANAPEENVFKFNAALGNSRGCIDLARDPKRVGAHYVKGRGEIPVLRIDDLTLPACDLIYLDVEGYELFVLLGAIKTIARCNPTIVVEDRKSSERFGIRQGSAVEFLVSSMAYDVVARTKRDVILRPS